MRDSVQHQVAKHALNVQHRNINPLSILSTSNNTHKHTASTHPADLRWFLNEQGAHHGSGGLSKDPQPEVVALNRPAAAAGAKAGALKRLTAAEADEKAMTGTRIQHHSHELRVRDRYRNIHIDMFCIRSRHIPPKFKGRSAEIKSLARPFLVRRCEIMDSTSVVYEQNRSLLQRSARMEDLVCDDTNEYTFASDAHAELMRHCEKSVVLSAGLHQLSGEGVKLFSIVPKHHFLMQY